MSSPYIDGIRPSGEAVIEDHIVSRIEYRMLDDGRVAVRGLRGAGRRILDELRAAGYVVVRPSNDEHRQAVREMMKEELSHAKRYADHREKHRQRKLQGGREGSVS